MKSKNNIWIVIPAYNEEKHIKEVITGSKKYGQVLVVDDGSKDKTSEIVKKAKTKLIVLKKNKGKGNALRVGCDYASKKGAEIIIVMDADGQHKPEDVIRFVKALVGADIVFGYRRINKNMPHLYRFGNGFINGVSNLFFHIKLEDTQCGFRSFKSSVYPKIRWNANDYSMESEMIARAGNHRLSYRKIKIDTIYKNKYKGTTIKDGIKIVFNLIWWKLSQAF